MLKILILSLALMAQDRTISISSTQSGVAGENLADTPLTDMINMDEGLATNQISWNLAVVPGTSAVVAVRCYESQDNVIYGIISICDALAASACAPDVRTFTLADYATVSGVKSIVSRWETTKQFVKCSADDVADGSGTVTITGARTWR